MKRIIYHSITDRSVALTLLNGEFRGRKVSARVRAGQSYFEQRLPESQMLECGWHVHGKIELFLLWIQRLRSSVPEQNLTL